MSDSMGMLAGEGASLLNNLTFDDEYVAKQRKIRANKNITGVADGIVEAGKSLATGVEGMFDVFTKPVQGAQTGGIGGFFTGLGSGAVSTFVKPISAMGQ